MQDDISSKIAEHLKLTLLKDYETATRKQSTSNLQAYEMFLKGDFYHKKYSDEGFEKAIEYFKNAAELDPNYTDAWWSLGLAYWETQAWRPLQQKEVIEVLANDKEKQTAVVSMLNYMEKLAIAVEVGVADEDTLREFFDSIIRLYYHALRGFIEYKRTDLSDASVFVRFESLAIRWSN